MKFKFYRRREKISDYFRPRKKIIIDCRKTVFRKGFKTDITTDPELSREAERIVELLSDFSEKRGLVSPFALSKYIEGLEDYKIRVKGRDITLDSDGNYSLDKRKKVISEEPTLSSSIDSFVDNSAFRIIPKLSITPVHPIIDLDKLQSYIIPKEPEISLSSIQITPVRPIIDINLDELLGIKQPNFYEEYLKRRKKDED